MFHEALREQEQIEKRGLRSDLSMRCALPKVNDTFMFMSVMNVPSVFCNVKGLLSEGASMKIVDLRAALEKDNKTSGLVYINEVPQVRSGRKNDYMVGRFYQDRQSVEFKIWEERTYAPVVEHGVGIYEADLMGSEYNGQVYITVRRIKPYEGDEISSTDFLARVPDEVFNRCVEDSQRAIRRCGASDNCFTLIRELLMP